MWVVKTTDRFDIWFKAQSDRDRANVLAAMLLLRDRGPRLTRPYADFVKGSRFGNMKEMRIQSQGRPIRAMFAFDPKREAVILCAGDKSKDPKRFYRKMVAIADDEFASHLARLNEG
jgi:hypothetical protein